MEQRRSTDQLDLTGAQQAFLDQVVVSVTDAVADAVRNHEEASEHPSKESVLEAVRMTLAAGDFLLPNGQTPDEMIAHHDDLAEGQKSLEARHDRLDKDMSSVLDVVVGPVEEMWNGEPDPDGARDETLGLRAQMSTAMSASQKLDKHLSNGGVPVKLPTGIKAAIWGAAATIGAAFITSAGIVAAAVLS